MLACSDLEKRVVELRIHLQNDPLIGRIHPGHDQIALRVGGGGLGISHLGEVQTRQPVAVEIHLDHACLLLPRGTEEGRYDEEMPAGIGGDGLRRAVGRIEKAKQNLVTGQCRRKTGAGEQEYPRQGGFHVKTAFRTRIEPVYPISASAPIST